MNKQDALPYVSFYVDDALSLREKEDMPADLTLVRFVGWQCGFEPLFVAVWSYLKVPIDDTDAFDIAVDFLLENDWFGKLNGALPPEPDYIL